MAKSKTAVQDEYEDLLDASLFENVPHRLATHDFYLPHEQYGMGDWPPSLTRQEFKEECDINEIMSRYQVTDMSSLNALQGPPVYVDFSAMPDNLQDAMNQMNAAQGEFMRLPAHVRREFDNDPVKFVMFASDAANLDQMRAWGLAEMPPEPPAPVRVVLEPQAAPAAPAAGAAAPGGRPAT